MSKSIILSEHIWGKLYTQLARDNPHSVILIREKMKKVLGFVPREHNYFNIEDDYAVEEIHLDFYDEQKRTMFLLKYSEFINETHR